MLLGQDQAEQLWPLLLLAPSRREALMEQVLAQLAQCLPAAWMEQMLAQVLQHCLLLGLGLRAQVLKHCRLLPNKKYAPWWQDEALHQAKSLLLIASPKAERQSTKRAGGPAATPCASFPL